tara:strand:- start:9577 stop:9684 length:108 start_codon:yes stop_codon:yes gene_type:complete
VVAGVLEVVHLTIEIPVLEVSEVEALEVEKQEEVF